MVILLRTPMVQLQSLVASLLLATLYLTAPLTQVLILSCLMSAAFACGKANSAARARGNTGKNFINILYGSCQFLRFYIKILVVLWVTGFMAYISDDKSIGNY